MDVICKKNPAGFLLISSLVVLTTMILIVSFYLNAIIQEIKITHITSESPQAYYLAETGVQEAIWKLQNDAVWKNNFETDPTWSATLTRNNVWGEGGSYTVTVANTTLASATITATSSIPVANSTTQRVVETNVFKAINPLPTDNIALFANNDVSSIGSEVNIIAGDLLGNKNVTFSFFSDWSVSGETKAVEDVAVGLGSHLATAAIHDSGLPPVPNKILMPAVDFDSTDPGSYKSRANQVYSTGQFAQLLKDSPTTTLNGITYVTGNAHIKKGQALIINGVLVSDGTITIGNGFSSESTPATLDVNHVAGQPSGVLAKNNITVGGFSSNMTVDGLVYSGGSFTLMGGNWSEGVSLIINGGIISQNIDLFSMWLPVNITLNQPYINETLGSPIFSQVLSINHWEEEY